MLLTDLVQKIHNKWDGEGNFIVFFIICYKRWQSIFYCTYSLLSGINYILHKFMGVCHKTCCFSICMFGVRTSYSYYIWKNIHWFCVRAIHNIFMVIEEIFLLIVTILIFWVFWGRLCIGSFYVLYCFHFIHWCLIRLF